MFNTPVWDWVILLSFTYFIGSLILTTINESLTSLFQLRGKDLKRTLVHLIPDAAWNTFSKQKILASNHILSLVNPKKRFPSYIPAANFVLAIIENLGPANYTADNIAGAITGSSLPDSMKNVLSGLLAKSKANVSALQNDLKAFEKELEDFYNNAMERTSGWYKRKNKRILLGSGMLIAIVLNIDTVKITNDALKDKSKLRAAADNIIAAVKDISSPVFSAVITGSDSATLQQTVTDTTIKNEIKKIKSLQVTYSKTTGYYMGYEKGTFCTEWGLHFPHQWFLIFLLKLIGCLITAFALQFGSNYWFDLLNKFINLRSTGKKPDEKK